MRRDYCRLALGTFGLLCGLVPRSYAQGEPGLSCIKDMMVPSYSYLARRSPNGGTVQALISLGKDGIPKSIEVSGADADIRQEVRDFLSTEATFMPACGGRTVELVFTFQLEGKPEATPPVFVRFRAPNHFVIISRPRSPDFKPARLP